MLVLELCWYLSYVGTMLVLEQKGCTKGGCFHCYYYQKVRLAPTLYIV